MKVVDSIVKWSDILIICCVWYNVKSWAYGNDPESAKIYTVTHKWKLHEYAFMISIKSKRYKRSRHQRHIFHVFMMPWTVHDVNLLCYKVFMWRCVKILICCWIYYIFSCAFFISFLEAHCAWKKIYQGRLML